MKEEEEISAASKSVGMKIVAESGIPKLSSTEERKSAAQSRKSPAPIIASTILSECCDEGDATEEKTVVVITRRRRRWLEVAIGESNRRRSCNRAKERERESLESFEVRYEKETECLVVLLLCLNRDCGVKVVPVWLEITGILESLRFAS